MRPLSAIIILMSLVATDAGATEAPRSSGNPSIAFMTPAVPEWKRPLPIIVEDARLVGEAASREFPIYLTASEASRMAKFNLSYRNAISVMPETFRITVKINDVVVGETSAQDANEAETLSLNVPVGVLQAGFNSVRVSVRQTHRVDCSVNATYELWTQLMPEQSGFAFTGASGEIRSLHEIAAVTPGPDGTTHIRVRTSRDREPAMLNQAARAVQAAVLLGHFAYPKVEFNPPVDSEPGLDIVVGAAPDIASSIGVRVPGVGPRHQIIHDLQKGNVTLIVSGDSAADVDAALDALFQQAEQGPPLGTAAGIRAIENMAGRQVEGGETIALTDLGVEAEPFRGRLQRQTVRIQMPSDLMAADYDRVTLSADAVYAAGLLPSSKLVVRVNGTAIANAPLSNTAGDVLSKRDFYLPVSTFKPGLNTIDLEAETRTGGDEKCSLQSLVDQRERFLLSGTSEIKVPTLGRVGALPNISSIIPGGLARLSGTNDIRVFIPKGRHEAIEAALTVLAKMASVSRHQSRPQFSFDLVPEGTRHVLAFGAYEDMPEATLRAAGLDPDKLRRGWHQPGLVGPEVADLKQRVQVASAGGTIALATNAPGGRVNVSETGSLIAAQAGTSSKSASMSKVFSSENSDWVPSYARSTLGMVSHLIKNGLAETGLINSKMSTELPIDEASTLVVAQGARVDGIGGGLGAKLLPGVNSTTVFVAPSPEELSHSVAELLSGSLWQQFVGDTAVYSSKDGAIGTRLASQILLVPTTAFDLHNIRLIAAGWLSRNIPVYLGILLGLFVVMTAFMQWALRSSGVRES